MSLRMIDEKFYKAVLKLYFLASNVTNTQQIYSLLPCIAQRKRVSSLYFKLIMFQELIY